MTSPANQNPSPVPTPNRNKFYSSQEEEEIDKCPLRRQPDFPTHHLLGNLDSLRTPRHSPQSFFPGVFRSAAARPSHTK